MSDLSISIFGLTKNNNGFFKSESQSEFLTSKMDAMEGFIGSVTSGYNSCAVFAEYDNKGITKITKSTKRGNVVMFDRKVKGILTTLEIKELKKLNRLGKKLKIETNDKLESFNNGNYNRSGDTSTYTDDMVERFNRFHNQRINQLKNINNRINEIN